MSIEDEQFRADVKAGLSIRALAKKYKISVRQVSRRKKRLKEENFFGKFPSPGPVPGITTGPVTFPSPNKRMSFWLTPGQIGWIKKKATYQRRTASSVLREILEKELKQK